jgi:hypothetical protein
MEQIVLATLVAMVCVLITERSTVGKAVPDSLYTVEHEVLMFDSHNYIALELTINGPPDDLLVFIGDGGTESKVFLTREQIASGKGKARFNFGNDIPAKFYQVTIKKSDITKTEGDVVYKGRIDFQGGSVEIVEVSVIKKWLMEETYARLHNSGDLPIKIDHVMTYSDEGEQEWSTPITIDYGEYEDVIVSHKKERGRDMRIYAYSNDKVVAKFEGKVE